MNQNLRLKKILGGQSRPAAFPRPTYAGGHSAHALQPVAAGAGNESYVNQASEPVSDPIAPRCNMPSTRPPGAYAPDH